MGGSGGLLLYKFFLCILSKYVKLLFESIVFLSVGFIALIF